MRCPVGCPGVIVPSMSLTWFPARTADGFSYLNKQGVYVKLLPNKQSRVVLLASNCVVKMQLFVKLWHWYAMVTWYIAIDNNTVQSGPASIWSLWTSHQPLYINLQALSFTARCNPFIQRSWTSLNGKVTRFLWSSFAFQVTILIIRLQKLLLGAFCIYYVF